LIFAALPAPNPEVFVGVLTLTKIISASRIASSMPVEKNKFLVEVQVKEAIRNTIH